MRMSKVSSGMKWLRCSRPRVPQALIALSLVLTAPPERIVYIPASDARPVLESMAEVLPAELRAVEPERMAAVWLEWVKLRDAEIRERLARGDEDTVVNLLFFGTSFTRQPRITSAEISRFQAASAAQMQALLRQRINDLVTGMIAPGNNERLQFARSITQAAGMSVANEKEIAQVREYLLASVERVLKEQSGFQRTLAAARGLDATGEFAERSKLYKERGLSLDTSLLLNYALEVALQELRDRGLLARGSVCRIGIIGPGLDFIDKQEGYDFYPTQTVQPFAVMDSLLRLGLSQADRLRVATLDLSPRVNEHIERARRAGAAGRGYAIQLPRDPLAGWDPSAVSYWQRFGDQIGSATPPVAVPPALRGMIMRAVRVRPEFARRLTALDVNIVLQREETPADGKFDLLIATNIFVYYDTFEQSLALANVQAMLRPGGFLLTNNLLLELPSSRMRAVDYSAVQYSKREAEGDRIVWYRREP